MLSLSRSPEGVEFWIHVTPRSRHERVAGTHGDALRVSVTAPPVEGAANAACGKARALGVRRSAVELDAGSRGRRKRVKVAGDAGELARRLGELAGEPGSQ